MITDLIIESKQAGRSGDFTILPVGTLPAEVPLDSGRVQALAHEGARLGYDLVRIEVEGIRVHITSKFSPAIHARRHGMSGRRDLPIRPELMGLTVAETTSPAP